MPDDAPILPIRPESDAVPAPGCWREIAPGLIWLRLALPYALDHVNAYLLADGDGWAVLDTGIADDRTRAAWAALLDRDLAGARVTRVIASHFHPDHVGLAGWLCGRDGAPLWMSRSEYLLAAWLRATGAVPPGEAERRFYRRSGLDAAASETLLARTAIYQRQTDRLPEEFRRVIAGGRIAVGGREFAVSAGGGHAIEMLMLHDAANRVFFPADQVLARISPNVAVSHVEPEGDPLGEYMESLRAIAATVPDDVLVLPAHDVPFRGLHARIAALLAHHEGRCAVIETACAAAPRSVAELIPLLFRRTLDAQQMGFAFGEALAHVNRLLHAGRLRSREDADGVVRCAL